MRDAKIILVLVFMSTAVFGQTTELTREEKSEQRGRLSFVDLLGQDTVVTTKREALETFIKERKLKFSTDYLLYCDKAVVINAGEYPDDPKNYLEAIHKKTASVLPRDLKFTDFKFKVASNKIVCSLTCNQRKYYQESSYTYPNDRIDEHLYYKIFNKVLTDIHSRYRVHLVEVDTTDKREAFGIIALSRGQTILFERYGMEFSASEEPYSLLSSHSIDNTIKYCTEMGFFDHLTKKQIAAIKEKISHQNVYNIDDLLARFPGVVYWYESEIRNTDSPYSNLVRELTQISRGEFKPIGVSDNFNQNDKEEVTLRFKLNESAEELSFRRDKYNGIDLFHSDFFNSINKVCSKNAVNGKFYIFYNGGGKGVYIIFLTREQYEYFKSHQLGRFLGDY